MDNMRLVIAGALFHDYKKDILVIPNRTGQFVACECQTYYKKDDFIKKYGRKLFRENKDYSIEDSGDLYYLADERELIGLQNLDLISDLSKFIFTD